MGLRIAIDTGGTFEETNRAIDDTLEALLAR